jgi:hypothetical protein
MNLIPSFFHSTCFDIQCYSRQPVMLNNIVLLFQATFCQKEANKSFSFLSYCTRWYNIDLKMCCYFKQNFVRRRQTKDFFFNYCMRWCDIVWGGVIHDKVWWAVDVCSLFLMVVMVFHTLLLLLPLRVMFLARPAAEINELCLMSKIAWFGVYWLRPRYNRHMGKERTSKEGACSLINTQEFPNMVECYLSSRQRRIP